MYGKLGVDVATITLWTSLITWPWTLKMFWGPFVDSNSTKRNWVLLTQALILVCLFLVAFGIHLPNFFTFTLIIFFGIAFLSATHDIACDGFYLLALKKDQQAFFSGIRSTAFRGAMLFANGGLVVIAGILEERKRPIAETWTVALLIGAIVYGVFFLYGLWALPKPAEDKKGGVRKEGESIPFREAVSTFFRQDGIGWILAFILLFRFGESMVTKIVLLFLSKPVSEGALGISTKHVGWIYGTVGMIALVLGGILGGWLISKNGLRRCLWPMVVCMHVPNLLYVWLAFTHQSLAVVTGVVAIESFGYGFGLAAYMIYLMFVSETTQYKTSHYAIATGIMALGAMAAGILSGILVKNIGYAWFFVTACVMTVPGTLILFFIPLEKQDINVEAAAG